MSDQLQSVSGEEYRRIRAERIVRMEEHKRMRIERDQWRDVAGKLAECLKTQVEQHPRNTGPSDDEALSEFNKLNETE